MGLPVKKGSIGFAIFVLFFALCISAVAAYYSIAGLMAIFAGAAVSIAIMGGVLEVGKLVAASWLYNNWKRAPFLMKTYLTTAVVVLMFITSMGIFGFLSKAHLEQTAPSGNQQALVERYEFDIQKQEQRIVRAEKILNQFDKALEAYIAKEYITRGLKERAKQKPEREALQAEIEDANTKILTLQEKKFEAQKEIRGLEAEVGPIKYIAALVYEDEADEHLDKAVRWMIILLIFVFDPLAVLLVIAGNMSIAYTKEDKLPEAVTREIKEETAAAVVEEDIFDEPEIEIVVEEEEQEEEDTSPDIIDSDTELVVDKLPEAVVEATDPQGGRLPVPIEVPVEEPKPYWIDIEGAVDDVFESTRTPFNLDSPEGKQLKKQLVKALRKNKDGSR